MTRSFVARLGTAALMAMAALMLAGCLGKSGGGSAQLRVINLATGSDTNNVAIALTNGSQAYSFPTVANAISNGGQISGYTDVNATAYSVNLTPGGTGTPVARWASLGSGAHYTGVVWGSSSGLQFATLQEDDVTTSISAGFGAVRILNATGSTGAIKVYLTLDTNGAELPLSQATPIALVQGSTVSSFASLPQAANYRLRVQDATSNNILLDTTPVAINSQQYTTIVVTSATDNGVLANASLIVEQGGFTQLVQATAVPGRLRIAAGVEQSGVVSVTVDGVAFNGASGYTSPIAGAYANIAAGAHTIAVSVGSTVVQTLTQTVANGTDYTLLVAGPAASPTVLLNTDDNSLPLLGDYKIRAINGSSSAGPITVNDNFTPVVSSVSFGTISGFNNYLPDLAAQLNVVAGNTTLQSWGDRLTPLQLPAGAAYSVFVLGGGTSPVATLIRDR